MDKKGKKKHPKTYNQLIKSVNAAVRKETHAADMVRTQSMPIGPFLWSSEFHSNPRTEARHSEFDFELRTKKSTMLPPVERVPIRRSPDWNERNRTTIDFSETTPQRLPYDTTRRSFVSNTAVFAKQKPEWSYDPSPQRNSVNYVPDSISGQSGFSEYHSIKADNRWKPGSLTNEMIGVKGSPEQSNYTRRVDGSTITLERVPYEKFDVATNYGSTENETRFQWNTVKSAVSKTSLENALDSECSESIPQYQLFGNSGYAGAGFVVESKSPYATERQIPPASRSVSLTWPESTFSRSYLHSRGMDAVTIPEGSKYPPFESHSRRILIKVNRSYTSDHYAELQRRAARIEVHSSQTYDYHNSSAHGTELHSLNNSYYGRQEQALFYQPCFLFQSSLPTKQPIVSSSYGYETVQSQDVCVPCSGRNETIFCNKIGALGLFHRCSQLPTKIIMGVDYTAFEVEFWRWSRPSLREKIWSAYMRSYSEAKENAYSLAIEKLNTAFRQNEVEEKPEYDFSHFG